MAAIQKNIAITESYLQSVFKLNNQSKRLTLNTINQLSENSRSTSLNIHSIDRQKCDPKFRSARVNDDLRVIFVMQGDTYTLLFVDHHDKAYDWCEGKYLAKTDFGAEYIYDRKVMLAEKTLNDSSNYFQMNYDIPLLEKAKIKEKHVIKLGIPQIHAKNLLAITSEDSFIDYITIFPTEIQEALLDLAGGTKTYDEVLNELIDVEFEKNTDKPLKQKDSMRRFYIPQSMEELQILMENDNFEKWTIFLHPSQERIITKNFKGAALIEGGPGTGKTIVGIHRAVYLAENVFKAADGKKILLCTFSKKLAKVIFQKLDKLMKLRGVKNNVDVVSIDSFIYSTLRSTYGNVFSVNPSAFSNMLDRLYNALAPKETKGFYQYEYFEIIERYNIKTLADYLKVDRSGTKVPLDKKARITAWKFIEALLYEKEKNKIYTFVDRANALLEGFENGEIMSHYDSIIIDEAQDLEPIKIKALCRCVRTTANNIMILSDMNQRIFKLTTWKNDGGLNVVGRTHYLSINYRTTKQINDYARHQFISSEMVTAHIKEYKSIMNGVEPTVVGFKNASEQYRFLVSKTKEFTEKGYEANQICVVCPTKEDCNQIQSIFTFSDIKSTLLFDDISPFDNSGVCICPITGVKGLEFEVVIIYDYNNIGKGRLNDADSPEVIVNYTKLIECEKYVAATRARDELIITYMEVCDKYDFTSQ